MAALVWRIQGADVDSASVTTQFEQPMEAETNASAVLDINSPTGNPFTNSVGMRLVKLPAGYWVGVYEVTQTEYERVMQHNPSEFQGGTRPVDSVSWQDAMTFCRKLTELERSAGKLPDGFTYTLPTQQQWEYFVADAPLEDAVTSQHEQRASTMAVGGLPPNSYGLYDTRGNLWEWCSDAHGGFETHRVLRGASWATSFEVDLRLAFRFYASGSDERRNTFGLRCILIPEATEATSRDTAPAA